MLALAILLPWLALALVGVAVLLCLLRADRQMRQYILGIVLFAELQAGVWEVPRYAWKPPG